MVIHATWICLSHKPSGIASLTLNNLKTIQYIFKNTPISPQSHPKLPKFTWVNQSGQIRILSCPYSSSRKSANKSLKFVNIVPWFCDIGNTRGRKTCITMAWRLWFHSERINNDRTTADRQTPQKACKIDGCGNITGAGDPNHRTDPDKNLYNDEQIQKPVCASSRTQRTTSIDRMAKDCSFVMTSNIQHWDAAYQVKTNNWVTKNKSSTCPTVLPFVTVSTIGAKQAFAAIPPLTLVGLRIKSTHFTAWGCCSKAMLIP